ncbi:hypothetical protein KAI92_03970 [Candidatus Parcubacteria bacterium]|nr:hypothetical protein [Candidatus Parcubacteria bacterium]
MLKKHKFIKILAISFLLVVFFSCKNLIKAQTQHKDTIAVRVIVNPEHYSPMRWYQEQGFIGSPQKMVVDGYQAIRDGRTVYVGAANVQAGDLYTNIYLMSYNQDAEQDTMDIYSRLLKRWKFNHNFMHVPFGTGECVGKNKFLTGVNCFLDSDCEIGEYCNSMKSNVIRDTRRLADIVDIKIALENYNKEFGHYPTMEAGSYLPYRTLSVWPSWNESFRKILNIDIPSDPINDIGDCGTDNYNKQTCWDDEIREFAGTTTVNTIALPASCSRTYVFTGNKIGTKYDVCAVFDTTYSNIIGDYKNGSCYSSSAVKVDKVLQNSAPYFVVNTLAGGIKNKEYIGYIKAVDFDGDRLTWTIVAQSAWLASGWVMPELQNTSDINQKRFYSTSAGNVGNYSITINIDDGKENITKTFNLLIFP